MPYQRYDSLNHDKGEEEMKTSVIVAVAAGVLMSGTVRAQNADFKGFPDVPKSHWAYQAVTELAQKGILQGYPAEKRTGKLTLTSRKVKTTSQAASTKHDTTARKR